MQNTPQAGVFLFNLLHILPMSRFVLLVNSPPLDSQGAYRAWRFACAAIEQGHQIQGVFFYQAGVLNANQLQTPFSDEHHLYASWCQLAEQHQVELLVCVSAANRRGVQSIQSAADNPYPQVNLHPPFSEVGLGELAMLSQQCDRLVQF